MMADENNTPENDGGHASLLGSSGDIAADLLGGIDIGTRSLRAERRSRSKGLARRVVDDLRIDVLAGAVDREARLAARNALDSGADAAAAAFEKGKLCHLTSSSLPCGRCTRHGT